MHVGVALIVTFVVLLAILLIAGLTPVLGIPLFVVLLVVPAMWAGFAKRLGDRTEPSGEVPTSGEASYDPVVRP